MSLLIQSKNNSLNVSGARELEQQLHQYVEYNRVHVHMINLYCRPFTLLKGWKVNKIFRIYCCLITKKYINIGHASASNTLFK